MIGSVIELSLFEPGKEPYGYILGNDGKQYYFNQSALIKRHSINDLHLNDKVSFSIGSIKHGSKKTITNRATHINLETKAVEVDTEITKYMRPGYARRLDLDREVADHLKPQSGEKEIIEKFSKILNISRIGHHWLDQTSLYPFCLVGVTDVFRQYIRESGEFLIIFSHFDNCEWQQKTLKVERELRKRREIAERRPLVNFYILVSNATELRRKIDNVKGEPQAAIIPFSFEELLACKSKQELSECVLSRFGEYYFENNMLGENNAIDDDNLLFGDRGKIADSIVARCHQGSNSGIFGLRRSGKTSVLNAVLRRLDLEGTMYVLIESRTYETFSCWKAVLYEIMCAIRAKLLGIERNDEETHEQFLSRLDLSSTLKDYNERGVACFIEDIRRYCSNQLFVIALDEIELITYNTATSSMWKSLETYKGFWSALRGCGCSLVVCGVNSTINEISNLVFQGEQCDNPMYGRIMSCAESSKTYLPAFTDEQTKEMINTLGRYSNIAFSQVYSQINTAFGGQPWAIRQFCSYIFSRVKDQRTPTRVYEVSKATCDNLLRDFKTSAQGVNLCETILQHLSIYQSEYTLLKKIALSPDKYNTISSNDVVSIDHLQKYGLIERDPTTKYITFMINIIKEYIQTHEIKAPEDMNNDERRKYVQDGIATCERKLKRYIINYYTYVSSQAAGKLLFFDNNKCTLKPHKGVDPAACSFTDFFDHKLFDFYFSKIKSIIQENWNDLGQKFMSINISKEKFVSCMDDLNAGRTDADHYDPENTSEYPEGWEIDDKTMRSFIVALDTLNSFFNECNL